jgi:hypothetical protein
MRRIFLTLAIAGYLLCLAMALMPGLNAFYPTEAYGGMCICALVGCVCLSGSRRWAAVLPLILGLAGMWVCWRHNARVWAEIERHRQSQSTGAVQQ